MSSVVNKEKAKIFETILSSPGMTEKCKIVLHISRQNIILLGRLLETGLLTSKNESTDEIISALPKEVIEELREVYIEILKKADLTEFYEKLKSIQA